MLERESKEHYVSPYTFAVVYARMGEGDRAIENLENTFDERYPSMFVIQAEPTFDGLRSHPRFQGLMRRMMSPT